MPARLLVIGLDAVETPLLERLCDEGRLPALAALRQRAVTAPMRAGCMDLLPGAIWQDIGTGRSAGRHGDFFPSRLHTGESVVRTVDPTTHADHYYWTQAARAGRRVAVVDQPMVPVITSVPEVTLVAEWHVHDQLWGRGSNPPELMADLEARHGHRPLDRCDSAHDAVTFGFSVWLDHLMEELRVKTDMAVDLLGREAWDLFTIVFSEGHCAGHQLWHLTDPASPLHPPSVPERLRESLTEVYLGLDTAIGRLIDEADAATTVVFTSHGMGPATGGPQLLGPLLVRLGMGDPRRLPGWIRPFLPMKMFQRFTRRRPTLGRRMADVIGERAFRSPGTKAMAVRNNRVGAIRLNVVGREPAGAIEPVDVDAELSALSEELLALRQPSSGEPIVERVVRPEDVYGAEHHSDLPDLLVVFRRDLGELTECEGPRSGHIHEEFRRPDCERTGDHTDRSRVWVMTTEPTAPRDIGEIDNLDLAPTLLAMLDLPPGPLCDGRPIAALVPADRGQRI